MNFKRHLIGFLLIVFSGFLHNLPAAYIPASILILIGFLMLMGFFDSALFIDYATFEDGNYVISFRIRHYFFLFPISWVLQWLRTDLKFIYRVDYIKITAPTKDLEGIDILSGKISRAEYKQLLQHQKQQYLNKTVPQDLVAEICAPEEVRVTRAKIVYLVPLILALLCLTVFTDPAPSSWIMAAVWGGLLFWLAMIRRGEYKEAKFKANAYKSYFTSNTQETKA